MGSVASKTNEDNTNRVTTVNFICFNGRRNEEKPKPIPKKREKNVKSE